MSAPPGAPPAVVIRAARADDADAVAALGDSAQSTYCTLLPGFFNRMDTGYWHSRFLRSLGLRDYFIFVADVHTPAGSVCAGYIELFIKRTLSPLVRPQVRLLIDNVVVAPDYRGGGIGSRLLEQADAFAREHGIDIIELQVAAGNDIALHLYAGKGYTPRSITMEKRLR